MQAPVETLARFARGESDATERLIVEAHLRLSGAGESLVRSMVESDPDLGEWETTLGAEKAEGPGPAGAQTGALPSTLLKRIQITYQPKRTREAESAGRGMPIGSSVAAPAGQGRAPDSKVPLPDDLLDDLRPQKEWKWISLWPCRGRIALVKTDPVTGTALYCARLEPGARAPRHRHLVREESLVLTGALCYDGVEVGVGDYYLKEAGTEHAPTILPKEACWQLVRQGAARSPLFIGISTWRRPLVWLGRLTGIPGV